MKNQEHHGPRHHRRERMNEALRDEIGSFLEGELADPRIGLATVVDVLLAADGKSARIFVAVEGDDAEAERTQEGLEAARGFIRHQIAERLSLRHAPELFFQVGTSREQGGRVEELLQRIEQRRRKRR
jgi:ribosome-binding factor A